MLLKIKKIIDMKKKWLFGLISILFLTLSSCKSNELVGKWDDTIKLSKKKYTLPPNPIL